MKTLLLLIITLFPADTSQYEKAMLQNIEALTHAKTIEELQKVSNTFERIALKETDRWEPLYYSAQSQIFMAIKESATESKDRNLDRALELIKKAYVLAPEEAELIALEGFVHMIRVTVDPPNRGQQYGALSMQTYGKALSYDPKNPRALLLMAQMEMGTANFFGNDISPYCEKVKNALQLFDEHKSDNILAPTWGKNQALSVYENCK